MTVPPRRETIRRILVPTDFSEGAARALGWALDLARPLGADVHLLHVLRPLETDAWSPLRLTPEEGVLREPPRKIVGDLLARSLGEQNTDGVQVATDIAQGRPVADAITACAKRQKADLVVVGTRGRHGVARFMLGSVAEEVARTSPAPVVLVPEKGGRPGASDVKRILVPVDFSPCSLHVLPWAKGLASALGAQIVLLSVVRNPPSVLEDLPLEAYTGGWSYDALADEIREYAEEEVQALAEEVRTSGLAVASRVEAGYPPSLILDVAAEEGVDLIAMASHGRTGLERFMLGSVTEKVMRSAPCPVLVVRATGEVSSSRSGAHAAQQQPLA